MIVLRLKYNPTYRKMLENNSEYLVHNFTFTYNEFMQYRYETGYLFLGIRPGFTRF